VHTQRHRSWPPSLRGTLKEWACCAWRVRFRHRHTITHHHHHCPNPTIARYRHGRHYRPHLHTTHVAESQRGRRRRSCNLDSSSGKKRRGGGERFMTIHASKPSLAELYPFLCLFSFAFFFVHSWLQKDGPFILIPRISKNCYIRVICVLFVLVSLTLETSQEQNAREANPPTLIAQY